MPVVVIEIKKLKTHFMIKKKLLRAKTNKYKVLIIQNSYWAAHEKNLYIINKIEV